MAGFDVAGILPTVQKNNLAVQTQARAVKTPKIQPAVPPSGPTGFWNRIGQVGIGKVNLANATKLAKTTGKDVGRTVTAAPSVALETAARVLPGGQNDIKANQEAVKSSNKTQQNVEALTKAGKITPQKSAQLLDLNALQANQTSQSAHADVQSGTVASQSKQGVQMLEATPRAIVNTAETAGKQVKYLAGSTSTPQQRQQIITNQAMASKNPEYHKATAGLRDSANSVQGVIQAQKMAASGAKAPAIRAALIKDQQAVDANNKNAAGNAVQIASLAFTGAKLVQLADKVTGKTVAKDLVAKTKTNQLVQAGAKANARDVNVGKAAVGAQQATDAKVANVGQKAVIGRQVTPEPAETKLLGPGTGKVTGKGFTASPSVDVAKVKTAARLNVINKKLSDVAQGKVSMSAEDVKSLKAEKDTIYKQPSESVTPAKTTSIPKTTGGAPARTRTKSSLERSTESTPQEQATTVTRGVTKLKPSPGPKVSGSVLKSESRAVEAGVSKEFEDKAGYNPTSYKVDAEKAVALAHENPDKAMDIATGKARGTSASHEVAVRRAVETKALNEGDSETLQKLATSPLHTATSEAAQRLGAEAYNADDASPVTAIQHVVAARTAAIAKKTGVSIPKAINDTAKEIATHEKLPTKFEWQSFVESIKC